MDNEESRLLGKFEPYVNETSVQVVRELVAFYEKKACERIADCPDEGLVALREEIKSYRQLGKRLRGKQYRKDLTGV